MLNMFVLLPKISAYQYKEETEKSRIRNIICTNVEIYSKAKHIQLYCFAENELAVELLSGYKNIKWISTLSIADLRFLKTNSDINYAVDVIDNSKIAQLPDLIKQAGKKFVVPDAKSFDKREDYVSKRFSVMNSRSKFVVNSLVSSDTVKNILFFEANNNFASRPNPIIGDGKKIVIHDVVKYYDELIVGGINLNPSMIKDVFGLEI